MWRLLTALVLLGWGCDGCAKDGAEPRGAEAASDDDSAGESDEGERSSAEADGYEFVRSDRLSRHANGRMAYGELAEPAKVGAYEVPKGTHVYFDEQGRPTRAYHPDEPLDLGRFSAAAGWYVTLRSSGKAEAFNLAEDAHIGEDRYVAHTALTIEADGRVGRPDVTYYGAERSEPVHVHLPSEVRAKRGEGRSGGGLHGMPPGHGGTEPRDRGPAARGADDGDEGSGDGNGGEAAGDADAGPDIDKEAWTARIRAAVREQAESLDPCLKDVSKPAPLGIWAQAGASGEVTAVTLPRDTPDELATCIDEAVRSWSFDVGEAPAADLHMVLPLAQCEGGRKCLRKMVE